MNLVLNANDNVTNANSDADLKAGSEAGLGTDLKVDFNPNDAEEADLVSRVLITEADKS